MSANPATIDRLAVAVAERLLPRLVDQLVSELELDHVQVPARDEPVDAAALARLLGVSRGYVYEHQKELGVMRLGEGPKARLRFDVERARAAFQDRDQEDADELTVTSPRRRVRSNGTPLLPIRGDNGS